MPVGQIINRKRGPLPAGKSFKKINMDKQCALSPGPVHIACDLNEHPVTRTLTVCFACGKLIIVAIDGVEQSQTVLIDRVYVESIHGYIGASLAGAINFDKKELQKIAKEIKALAHVELAAPVKLGHQARDRQQERLRAKYHSKMKRK